MIHKVKLNEEIESDPDFENDSVDPFDSEESGVDDSDHEIEPQVQRTVDYCDNIDLIKKSL